MSKKQVNELMVLYLKIIDLLNIIAILNYLELASL